MGVFSQTPVVRNKTTNFLMKQDCIDKICNLPLTFKQVDKSFNALLTETKFDFFNNPISASMATKKIKPDANKTE